MQTIVHLLTDQGLAPYSVIRWAAGIQFALMSLVILITLFRGRRKVLPCLKKWWVPLAGTIAILGVALWMHSYTVLAVYVGWLVFGYGVQFLILHVASPRMHRYFARARAQEQLMQQGEAEKESVQ